MRPTSAVAAFTWPVTLPSCSIWAYASLNVVAERLQQHPDVGVGERAREVLRRVRDDDEVGVIGDDRLDVRREAGQARLRRRLRVVGLIVDRDHLLAGADREQRLGGRGRQRDDPVRELRRPSRACADTVDAAIPTASAARTVARRCFTTNPPSARGSVCRRAVGLLTRGSPSAAFPASQASGVVTEGISPHSGGTVPDLHRVP